MKRMNGGNGGGGASSISRVVVCALACVFAAQMFVTGFVSIVLCPVGRKKKPRKDRRGWDLGLGTHGITALFYMVDHWFLMELLAMKTKYRRGFTLSLLAFIFSISMKNATEARLGIFREVEQEGENEEEGGKKRDEEEKKEEEEEEEKIDSKDDDFQLPRPQKEDDEVKINKDEWVMIEEKSKKRESFARCCLSSPSLFVWELLTMIFENSLFIAFVGGMDSGLLVKKRRN